MIGIHMVHRRLAELTLKATRLGGHDKLSSCDKLELEHWLELNAKIVQQLDGLKELSFIAYQLNDTEWQLEICQKIDALESELA